MADTTPNEASLRDLFAICSDVKFEKYELSSENDTEPASMLLIYCYGMCDIPYLNRFVLPGLLETYRNHSISSSGQLEEYLKLRVTPFDDNKESEAIVRNVFQGQLLLWFEPICKLYAMDVADPPKRTTEEPNTEVSVKGPKDGFTEEISVNLALIRKRLKTNQLAVETYTLGDETKTNVCLLFMNNKIKPEILSEIRSKLSGVKLPGLISSTQLEEALAGFSLFPMFAYTGRPDFAVNSLLHGRFILLVNGSPTASVAPVTLSYMLNTSEDAHTLNMFVFFTRIMRLVGLLFSLFLPGFWIALLSFHQDQIPFSLLSTLILSRQGVPLPVPLEAFVMLLLFELFREAGMRLPSAFGQTLSVVGGLIIGQAAISAGITAPGILVIVAISVLATFTLVNQHMVGIVSILRVVILLVSGTLGMFGFLICLLAIALYLVNLKSFGTYYMEPLAPAFLKDLWKVLLRTPWGRRFKVPSLLQKTKRSGGGKPR
ncbi:spore germination protein [Paenibacillus sp. GYB004]|uniref:spore germination protein n=1 Tax=Paenibacillus sp. GYB004 TaxID=2994393 RepID=UPI002F968BA2